MTKPPSLSMAKKIARIQSRIPPLTPAGELVITKDSKAVKIPYLTKNQVLDVTKPLMADENLACIYGGVDHVDTISKEGKIAGTYVKGDVFIQRYWVFYHFVDLENDDVYTQCITADIFGTHGSGTTIALAFAERDILIQTFLIHSNLDIQDDEGYTSLDVAKKLDMEDLREVWEHKAVRAVHKITRHKVDEEAKKRGIAIPVNLSGAPMRDLVEVMDICMEIMYPSTEKEHLQSVGRKGKA